MTVTVKIYAFLRYYLPAPDKLPKDDNWEMPERATVGHVLEKLDLPSGLRLTILLNGNTSDEKAELKEGDVLHLLPQMAGG